MSEITMSKYYFSNDFKEFEDLMGKYYVKKKNYKPKELVSAHCETLKYGYYIISGILKLSIGSECGREKILALFGPGSIFPLGVNDHFYKLEYAIIEQAFTDLEVYEFPFLELKRMFCENQKLGLKMMEHYCDLTSFLFYEISSLSTNNAIRKVCNIIYALINTEVFRDGVIKLGQNDIADFGGMSKVQVARAYQELIKRGIIQTKRNGFIVTDKCELIKLCSPDYLEY